MWTFNCSLYLCSWLFVHASHSLFWLAYSSCFSFKMWMNFSFLNLIDLGDLIIKIHQFAIACWEIASLYYQELNLGTTRVLHASSHQIAVSSFTNFFQFHLKCFVLVCLVGHLILYTIIWIVGNMDKIVGYSLVCDNWEIFSSTWVSNINTILSMVPPRGKIVHSISADSWSSAQCKTWGT